jgi:conjugative relaxase-like TrwC/TraI family protein
MHQGAFARANAGGRSGRGGGRHRQAHGGPGGLLHPRAGTDHEAYLSGHGESPGRWYGAGASALGLQGEASVAGFQAMFEGRDPTTGELLGRPHGRNAVPAFDVVLRPTKSVSILYGLGDPATSRAVLAAYHAALADAVGYLDEHLGARRGHGGVQHVSGQGLLAVGFDHRTSRDGDPLLHTHLVMANRVQGPDGRWTAVDGRDLYRHRLAADAIYRATYQRELVRTLGVEWTNTDTHGNRELQGLPEALVRGFSKRTDQIDSELDRLAADGGERTPRLVKWAVHATVSPKSMRQRTPCMDAGGRRRPVADTTRTPWSSRWPAGQPTASRTRRCPGGDWSAIRSAGRPGRADRPGVHLHPPRRARRPGRRSGRRQTDRTGGASRPVPGRAGGQRGRRPGPGGAPLVHPRPAGGRAAAGHCGHRPDRRADGSGLPSGGGGGPGRPSHRRRGSAGDGPRPVPGRPRRRSGRGRAGTGKTFALGIARHAWQLDGYRLLAAAPTGIATISLQGEGFEDVACLPGAVWMTPE